MFFSFRSSPPNACIASGTACSDCAPDFCAVTTTSSSPVDVARPRLLFVVVSCAHARPDVAASTVKLMADTLMRLIDIPSRLVLYSARFSHEIEQPIDDGRLGTTGLEVRGDNLERVVSK